MVDRIFLVVAGAFAFWVPAPLAAALLGRHLNFVLLNTLPVGCSLCLYMLLTRVRRLRNLRTLPIYMLLGTYLLGPLAIMLTSAAIQGGLVPFPASGRDLLSLIAISVFPPLTMLVAGNNGVILGLLAITAVFVVAAVVRRRLSV